jgi:hypothetical protein
MAGWPPDIRNRCLAKTSQANYRWANLVGKWNKSLKCLVAGFCVSSAGFSGCEYELIQSSGVDYKIGVQLSMGVVKIPFHYYSVHSYCWALSVSCPVDLGPAAILGRFIWVITHISKVCIGDSTCIENYQHECGLNWRLNLKNKYKLNSSFPISFGTQNNFIQHLFTCSYHMTVYNTISCV